MDIELRFAAKEDFKIIWDILRRAKAIMDAAGIDQWDDEYPSAERLSEDIKCKELYILSIGSEIVSFVVINNYQDPEYLDVEWKYTEGKVATIHRLCVCPERQGSGLGRKTMLLSEKEALRKGAEIIRLDTFFGNHSAIRLYEGLGYEKCGEVTFKKGKFFCYEKKLT